MYAQGLLAASMTTLRKESRLQRLNWHIQFFLKEPKIKKNKEDEKEEQLEAKRREIDANIERQKKAKDEAEPKAKVECFLKEQPHILKDLKLDGPKESLTPDVELKSLKEFEPRATEL